TVAVTRHMRLDESTAAASIVVSGSETFVRLSQGHTGTMPGNSASRGASAALVRGIAPASTTAKLAGLLRRRRFKRWVFMAAPLISRLPIHWQRAIACGSWDEFAFAVLPKLAYL